MDIVIEPLIGITIDGRNIDFGMKSDEVADILGEPKVIGSRSYYFDSELAVDCDENGYVEFIEFLGGNRGKLKPYIYGVSAFECDADELLYILSRNNNREADDSENGYSYAFANIAVGIYREYIPEDTEGDSHFDTIGAGKEGYYE